jgi:carbonic anhydrase/acetyltransferase-like protein (isoleucine patch superfamily)
MYFPPIKFNSAFGVALLRQMEKDQRVQIMGDVVKQLTQFLSCQPRLGEQAFVARGAVLVGDVTLGDFSSVWYNAVLRADINRIVVGHHSNIQDNCVVHLADAFPCLIGNYTTIGHGATIHACTLEDECLVGMGASILDGAIIGAQSLIGARSLVTEHARIPPGSLVLGIPGKVVRQLTTEERAGFRKIAEKYVIVAAAHKAKESAQ